MPPKGIMDLAADGRLWGCSALKEHVQNVIKPKVHIFGHVHEGYGFTKINSTTYINASNKLWPADPRGRKIRDPIVFDFNVKTKSIVNIEKKFT
jgi:Icc-related predicted phosphoesterase